MLEARCETPTETTTEKAKWAWEAVEVPGPSPGEEVILDAPSDELLCPDLWENSAS